ncbi:MAG: hypothetical protein SGJ18_08100 [Pseudomonadota bacterium]|nr:hypothetical protein [Pseudomonadota bacterium]
MLNSKYFLIIFILLFTFSLKGEEVILIKQWHLSPGEKTTDIAASKLRPQFTNQLDIYYKLTELVNSREKLTLIQEGCEGEVTKTTSPEHYGWSYESLSRHKDTKDFRDILAFMPVKMIVKFDDKVRAICSDTKELIKKSLLAFSDLRGASGFYLRLKEFKAKKDDKNYKAYEAAAIPKDKLGKVDAIEFERGKVLESIKNIEDSLAERNNLVLALVKKTLKDNPVVVIGGLHVKDLTQKFKKEGIRFTIYSPKGYEDQDELLLEKFKEGL